MSHSSRSGTKKKLQAKLRRLGPLRGAYTQKSTAPRLGFDVSNGTVRPRIATNAFQRRTAPLPISEEGRRI